MPREPGPSEALRAKTSDLASARAFYAFARAEVASVHPGAMRERALKRLGISEPTPSGPVLFRFLLRCTKAHLYDCDAVRAELEFDGPPRERNPR